jgi:hypothetical protein
MSRNDRFDGVARVWYRARLLDEISGTLQQRCNDPRIFASVASSKRGSALLNTLRRMRSHAAAEGEKVE